MLFSVILEQKSPAGNKLDFFLVGRLGLEPRTNGLKGHCSTIELTAHENNSKQNYSNIIAFLGKKVNLRL